MNNLYCAAPWRGLHITTQGDVKPCCSGAYGFGNINNSDLVEIVENTGWQKLRQQIANNDIPDYCKICIHHKDANFTERAWHNSKNPDIDLDNLGQHHHGPAIIDVRWSNACNLMCLYCNPVDSSMWARKLNLPLTTKRKGYFENIIDYVQNNNKNLRVAALIGGEPLLIPQCADLIDTLPDDVEIHVISNLSIDLENNVVFQKLLTRQHVRWSISFDNTGQQFEYVRRGANWPKLLANLQKIKSLESIGHTMDIHCVLNILSIVSLDRLISLGLEQRIRIVFQYLNSPDELDLYRFPQPIIDKIKADTLSLQGSINGRWCDVNALLQYLNYDSNSDPEQIDKFYKFVAKNDTEQLQFASLWPELDKQLKECYNSYMN